MWGSPRHPFPENHLPQYVQATKWFGRQISFFSVFRPWDLGKGFTRACNELYVSLAAIPSHLGEIGDEENEEETGPGLRDI